MRSALFPALLLLTACAPTLTVNVPATPPVDLRGGAPDVVILSVAGRCGVPCVAPRDNWAYLGSRGTVDRVGKDIRDKMYVTLEGPEGSFRMVQSFFDDEDAAGLASLAPGRRLLVQCRCDGVFGNVLLSKCQIIE